MKRFFPSLLFIQTALGQGLLPGVFKMSVVDFDTTAYKGLKSNMISDVVIVVINAWISF